MKYRIKRKIGYVLVVAMLVVMIYPGELSAASGQEDGFVIKGTTLQGYVGAENAVVIPDNITKIDDDVFLNTTITSVEIPDSVTTIGDNAFAGCEYLTEVTVPDSVTKIGDNVFYGCTSLESATWESREGIGDGTFAECAGLTDLSISKELPSIGKEAFKNCESLESIVIPEATKTIASDAFDGCVNMQSIDVEETNTYFMSYDNALYTANGVTLYRCPQGARTIEVYDGTKMIGENAFYGCKLGKVTLPESVTTVEDGAFDGSEIQTLCLGKALETFGEQNTSFKIHSIEVPGSAPAAPKLVETYGAIVVTDYKPDDTEDTEKPTEDTEKPTEDTEKPTEDTESRRRIRRSRPRTRKNRQMTITTITTITTTIITAVTTITAATTAITITAVITIAAITAATRAVVITAAVRAAEAAAAERVTAHHLEEAAEAATVVEEAAVR